MSHVFLGDKKLLSSLYHPRQSTGCGWILRHSLSLFHQELPERLLLTYKPEEAEKAPEPVPTVEEKPQVVEEPAPVSSSSEIASPPPQPEIADTGDLLVSREEIQKVNMTSMFFNLNIIFSRRG